MWFFFNFQIYKPFKLNETSTLHNDHFFGYYGFRSN